MVFFNCLSNRIAADAAQLDLCESRFCKNASIVTSASVTSAFVGCFIGSVYFSEMVFYELLNELFVSYFGRLEVAVGFSGFGEQFWSPAMGGGSFFGESEACH